jgi:hypothetical protein
MRQASYPNSLAKPRTARVQGRPHPPIFILVAHLLKHPLHRSRANVLAPTTVIIIHCHPSWIIAMRSIHASVLSGQLEATLFSRSCLLAIASHYNRPAVRAGYPAPGRYWSSCPLRMAQSGTAFRGKQSRPLHSVALIIQLFLLRFKG